MFIARVCKSHNALESGRNGIIGVDALVVAKIKLFKEIANALIPHSQVKCLLLLN